MKIRGVSYFYILIIVIMLLVMGLSLRMPYFESKLIPLVVSGLIFILAAIALRRQILIENKLRTTIKEYEAENGESNIQEVRGYLIGVAWVAGFILAVYLVGFIIAIPLLILTYMRSHGIGWPSTVIFAVLLPVIVYFLFEVTMGVELHLGLLLTSLGY